MASFNRVVLVGNITRDPEIRTLPSGSLVVEVGLAVNERRKDSSGNWGDEVNFFDVTVWNRSAEIIRDYTRKGSPILVEGRLKQDTWEQDGQKRSKVKILADRIVLLSSRDGSSGGGYQQQGGGYQQQGGYQQGGYQSGGYQQQGGYQSGGYQSGGYQSGGYQSGGYQRQPQRSSYSSPAPSDGGGDYSQDAGGDDIPF